MTNFNQKWRTHLEEGEFDSSKIKIHDKLNSSFWISGKLDPEVSGKLMDIAQDFYESLKLEVPGLPEFEDVTFTGSLASYNYHDLSDIDLHLIVDFKKIKEGAEILEKFFTAKRIQWNNTHKIMIFDHEVEIYIQDEDEEHMANGVYSVLNNDWLEMPVKKRVDIDYEGAEKKYKAISKEIDELSSMFEQKKYQEVYDYTIKLKDKIKRMRKAGLQDAGAYSNENLAFKMLRINNELDVLSSLKISSYDKMNSIQTKASVKLNIAENWWNFLRSQD